MNEAGLDFTAAVILGLGGIRDSEEHIRETTKVLNIIQPCAVGVMALNPQSGTPLYEDIQSCKFELPTYRDILREEHQLLEGLEFDRPSEIWTGGFMPGNSMIKGVFPKDKEEIFSALDQRTIVNRMLDQKIMLNGGL